MSLRMATGGGRAVVKSRRPIESWKDREMEMEKLYGGDEGLRGDVWRSGSGEVVLIVSGQLSTGLRQGICRTMTSLTRDGARNKSRNTIAHVLFGWCKNLEM
jgi:hypothetical protein